MADQADRTGFTGRRRKRQTRWSVRLSDALARGLISAGGIGTIIAVSGICVYLVWVVIPLFQAADVTNPGREDARWQPRQPVQVAIDEFRLLGWALFSDGTADVFRVDTGARLKTVKVLEDAKLSASSFGLGQDDAVLAFSDGTVRLAEIGFENTFIDPGDVEARLNEAQKAGREAEAAKLEELAALQNDEATDFEGGMVQKTREGQMRVTKFRFHVEAPFKVASSRIELVAQLVHRGGLGVTGVDLVTFASDGEAKAHVIEVSEDMFTLEKSFQIKGSYDIPFKPRGMPPKHMLLSALGDKIYLAWEDGHLKRFEARNGFQKIRLVEEIDLIRGGGSLTDLDFLLGGKTLVAGDSTGRVIGCFPVRPEGTQEKTTSRDGWELRVAHVLPGRDAAVTALGMSVLGRVVAVGYADGYARVFHMTTRNLLAEVEVDPGDPVLFIQIGSKDDGLFAVTSSKCWRADYDPKHPEVTLSSVFLPVWYEGYAEPDTVWQSGGATESLEAKLSLWPLVYGTLKATFYSMLFGAPLALLAAIFTSEFLHPRVRARVKPTVEVMASLPSVVLGFMAALVFAPVIDNILPGTLACFIAVPVALLIGSQFWQMLPKTVALRWHRVRFSLMVLTVPMGVMAGLLMGPAVERWFFAGDIVRWLDGQVGNGIGAWMFLFLPLCAVLTAVLFSAFVSRWLREWFSDLSREQLAALNFLKLIVGGVVTLGLAWGVSFLLDAAGFDPRGYSQSYVGTYDQRNSLVVGFVMGFAIIPIIYTISEDALSTVPEHLRSASLGAGATQWQTAVRIVIPTAMSGLFSAMMIGLGRAVGETMIVLMATGCTPIKEWNIFNGFRTLSACIAIELPEAAKNTTHFRTLFLAALTLFVMTFCINTAAEIVRLRFRRRAYQL